jgi:hypothetical protein
VEYTRTIFVPIFPYIGDAAIEIGLYRGDERLPLAGDHVGQMAYRAASLQLLPQTDNLFTVFKDGWHPAEISGDNAIIEWQWTKKDATLAFRNPKRDALLYLDVDSPGGDFIGAQQVTVTLGGQPVETFALEPKQRVLRKIPLSGAQLGGEDIAELSIGVDKTFVPATVAAANSKDPRELGVRVFHAFVEVR